MSWEKVKLGDICDFINGGAWSDKEYVSLGIPVLKVSNFKPSGFFIDDINYLPPDSAEKYEKNKLLLNDVIIATVGSHPNLQDSAAGRSCVVNSLVTGFYLNQNAVCVRTKNNDVLEQRYLGFLAKTQDFLHYIQSSGRGAANQNRIYRYIEFAAKKCDAQVVLIDLGPNLGALNRAVLGGCDYFITPLSPDLFSIKGTQNLGNKFVVWHDEWENNLRKWKRNDGGIPSDDLPNGAPVFLGYVMQQHNIRNTRSGMTKGWEIFGSKVDEAVTNNIVKKLLPLQQVAQKEIYLLGKIPNLHSLIPYSLNAHKPVYKCTSQDGLTGSHLTKARESKELYQGIVQEITSVLDKENN